MKLFLSIDLVNPLEALDVAAQVGSYFDVIEVGTSLLKASGVGIVGKIKACCPDKPVFVDSKIIDGPEKEALLMCDAGADMFSMLACATDPAISKVLSIAEQHGVDVMFDMQTIADYQARCLRLKALGAHYLCVHKSADCGENLVGSFREYLEIQRLCGLQMAIAGGIDSQMLEQAKPILAPDIVIIGKSVVNAPDRIEKAQRLREVADR